MLQIATGIYFRPGARLHETTHRTTAYSNGFRIDRDPVVLPFATLHFDTGIAPFTPVAIEVVDRLEATDADGQSFGMVATGGEEIIDDAATLLAFTTNTTWSTDRDLVRRLVPPARSDRPVRGPASQLRRTFDPQVLLTDDDLADVAAFGSQLLALSRPGYDKAIRAIRRVVDATLLIADDVTLAYTLYVAALESLAADTVAPPASWQNYDGRKRALLDPVLAVLDGEQVGAVRAAVLRADALGLAQRFQAFTIDHLEPSYYRAEAVGAQRPISAAALPRALQFAYRVRSAQVHALQQLAPEMWAIGQRSDTLPFEGQTVLSLEGLNRLCRHVIRRYVERARTGVDTSFNYRAALPGQVRMQLAPQYWIWQADGLTIGHGPERLDAFLELLLPVLRGDDGAALVNMTEVLAAIEKLLPVEAVAAKRAPLVALYRLWHNYLVPEAHRPGKDRVLARFGADLDAPSAAAFAVTLLLDDDPPWPTAQLEGFIAARQQQRRSGSAAPLPDRFDAALLLCLARRLWREGRHADAVAAVADAVETRPGDAGLLAFEEHVRADNAAGTVDDSDVSDQGGSGDRDDTDDTDDADDMGPQHHALSAPDLRAFLLAGPDAPDRGEVVEADPASAGEADNEADTEAVAQAEADVGDISEHDVGAPCPPDAGTETDGTAQQVGQAVAEPVAGPAETDDVAADPAAGE